MKKYLLAILGLALVGLGPIGSLHAGEMGFSASVGFGGIAGPWSEETAAYSRSFSQEPAGVPFPAATLGADVLFEATPDFRAGASLGVGSWGGRIESSGGPAAPRTSTTALLGVELAGCAGPRFAIAGGAVDLEAKTGLGFLASDVWTFEAWKSSSLVAASVPSAAARFYGLFGLRAAYSPSVSGSSGIAFGLASDVGVGPFGFEGTTVAYRIGLFARYSRALPRLPFESREEALP